MYSAEEVKEHKFFAGIDWHQVYIQTYTPPLIPPRGEVNAADAFDIGSFDEEDTKGIKLTDADVDMYRFFPLTISERCVAISLFLPLNLLVKKKSHFFFFFKSRWQQEVSETVFETVNNEADKVEQKRKSKQKQRFDADEKDSDCILHGYIQKLGGSFASVWQKRYAKLYPNRFVKTIAILKAITINMNL